MLLTYSLKCPKLETLLAGDNKFDSKLKESIINRGISTLPNIFIDFTDDLNMKESIGNIIRRLKDEKRTCEILKFVEEPDKIKGRRFHYFYGNDSLIAAIGFGYLEVLSKTKLLDLFKKM